MSEKTPWRPLPSFRGKENIPPHRKDDGQRGFTLLEVLVALSVLAIALAILLPIFSGAVRNQNALAEERAVIALAQSKLDALGTEIPLADGVTEGSFDNGFLWRLEIAPYPTNVPNPQIFSKLATLIVRWRGPGGSHNLTIRALRLAGRQ